jgi:tRNA-splicing ligase RtcB
LPDRDLAYLREGTEEFDDYMKTLYFAQDYAFENRIIMMFSAMDVMRQFVPNAPWHSLVSVHCHHNYLAKELHGGENLFITRKGAVRAGSCDRGIIPGSMGARTYIVKGLGSPNSFTSCSHGAGRMMSRTAAKKAFTVEDHIKATAGVECDKTAAVLDETPGAYKDIEAVIAAQADLVEPIFHMRQFLCVKGLGEEKKWQKKKAVKE